MLLRFAFKDILDDRRFKNTTKVNIRNNQTLLGEFINYCVEQEVVNVENITLSQVKSELIKNSLAKKSKNAVNDMMNSWTFREYKLVMNNK